MYDNLGTRSASKQNKTELLFLPDMDKSSSLSDCSTPTSYVAHISIGDTSAGIMGTATAALTSSAAAGLQSSPAAAIPSSPATAAPSPPVATPPPTALYDF